MQRLAKEVMSQPPETIARKGIALVPEGRRLFAGETAIRPVIFSIMSPSTMYEVGVSEITV